MGNWLTDRVNLAAKAYNEWPDSFKEAFRLSTVVDRVPPTLAEGIALLAEVDRLTSLCANYREALAKIAELTFDADERESHEELAINQIAIAALQKEGNL